MSASYLGVGCALGPTRLPLGGGHAWRGGILPRDVQLNAPKLASSALKLQMLAEPRMLLPEPFGSGAAAWTAQAVANGEGFGRPTADPSSTRVATAPVRPWFNCWTGAAPPRFHELAPARCQNRKTAYEKLPNYLICI